MYTYVYTYICIHTYSGALSNMDKCGISYSCSISGKLSHSCDSSNVMVQHNLHVNVSVCGSSHYCRCVVMLWQHVKYCEYREQNVHCTFHPPTASAGKMHWNPQCSLNYAGSMLSLPTVPRWLNNSRRLRDHSWSKNYNWHHRYVLSPTYRLKIHLLLIFPVLCQHIHKHTWDSPHIYKQNWKLISTYIRISTQHISRDQTHNPETNWGNSTYKHPPTATQQGQSDNQLRELYLPVNIHLHRPKK